MILDDQQNFVKQRLAELKKLIDESSCLHNQALNSNLSIKNFGFLSRILKKVFRKKFRAYPKIAPIKEKSCLASLRSPFVAYLNSINFLADSKNYLIKSTSHHSARTSRESKIGNVKIGSKSHLDFTAKPALSLYIYGGVGRGKTMLMKIFFAEVLSSKKIYFHFNSFMISLHQQLHFIRQNQSEIKSKKDFSIYSQDDLIAAVQMIIGNPKLICFDEFQVTDVADAMLLSRIFSYFFLQKILVVITSNSHPLQLYKDGLQREKFLEFVREILLKNCQILHLDSPHDYRQISQSIRKFYFLDNQAGRIEFAQIQEKFCKNHQISVKILEVFGRKIEIKKLAEDIALIDASWLVAQEFYIGDFKTICQNFSLIFLTNLNQFSESENNEIRRFTAFIDEVYENRVALLILAKCEIDQLCQTARASDFFMRTTSRLSEISGTAYWKGSKFLNISVENDVA